MKEIKNREAVSLLKKLIKEGHENEINSFVSSNLEDIQLLVSRLKHSERTLLIRVLDEKIAAEVLASMPDENASSRVIQDTPIEKVTSILENIPSDERVDLIKNLDKDKAEEILASIDDDEVKEIKQLITYADDSVGGLMCTEYLTFHQNSTVKDVIKNFYENSEKYRNYDIQYIYVVGENEKLQGVLPLRELLIQHPDKKIQSIMITRPISLDIEYTLETVQHTFDIHRFLALPVVNSQNVFLGIVKRNSLEELVNENSNQAILKLTGIIGGEEYRSMPIWGRIYRRLSWLTINVVLNFFAASIIALYQDTLMQLIALAVFIPIISDMSGCSGNQALAVSLRELSLGLIRPIEIIRIWRKEFFVGLCNGIFLGTLIGCIAMLWQNNIVLAIAVGLALSLNSVVAVCLGGSIPLILKSLKIDPALASGPILTTITDLIGFLLIFSFASTLMQNFS